MQHVLFIYPKFSPNSFWNYSEVCKLVGAKYPSPPLGLITVAALLPKHWEIKLIDLNTTELKESDIQWASLVFIGGMLPQQPNFLSLIETVHRFGKKVVAGGPDPTAQPDIYKKADYLVLGEAECSIHLFLSDLENGVPHGTYQCETRPDMATSPVPRFDLLNFNDYMGIGIQFCRGCPFNCEFCDIIELYGRKTRSKTTHQIIAELQTLYDLGYRGEVSFVDDNFIGNKNRAKEILRQIYRWSKEHKFPFYYSTEVSINLADDDELLGLMRDIDFRNVFIGIESSEENILQDIKKKQNMNRTLEENIMKIHSYGMVVTGGFILGFDNETDTSAEKMVDLISKSNIIIPMIGLLYALPLTQLTKRLEREERLSQDFAKVDASDVDQATSGINFITRRPREAILNDFKYILETVFSVKNYFNRCLRLRDQLQVKPQFKLSFKQKCRYGLAFIKIGFKLGLNPSSFYYYWRNVLTTLVTTPSLIGTIVSMMAMFIHFKKQTKHILDLLDESLSRMKTIETKG